MRKAYVFFAMLWTVALVVHAQSKNDKTQPNLLAEKAEKLAKTADSNRQDWRAQYDAGCCYLDTTFSASQYMEAETYLRRALDIAMAQEVKRDTILGKTLMAMSNLSARRNNYKEILDYHQKATKAYLEELGPSDAAIPPLFACLACETTVLYCMGVESGTDLTDAIKLFRTALQLYDQQPEEQQAKNGREDVETAYSYTLEILMTEQKNLSKNKVWQWTDREDNGRKYIVLAFDDWTLESSSGLLATMLYNVQNDRQASDRKRGVILMDEQGNVTEREHGQFDFNLNYLIEGNRYTLNQNTTFRMTSVTPERRKELIDALNAFEQRKQEN